MERKLLIHKFYDYMTKWYFTKMYAYGKNKSGKIVRRNKMYPRFEPEKLHGYDAIQKMDEFCKRHPEISAVGVDDNHFASSMLYLMPSIDEGGYFGTDVIFIPQCTKTKGMFFLYPEHLDNLIKELRKFQTMQRKISGRMTGVFCFSYIFICNSVGDIYAQQ